MGEGTESQLIKSRSDIIKLKWILIINAKAILIFVDTLLKLVPRYLKCPTYYTLKG